MRHATILVAILAFVPLAGATAQEQLAPIIRDVGTTRIAAVESVLMSPPAQVGQGPRSRWCRSWDPCLRGGTIGLLVGAGVGAVIGLASGDEPPGAFCFLACTAYEKAAIGAVAFGVVGAVIGYAMASSGQHERFLVSVTPQPDSRFALEASVKF